MTIPDSSEPVDQRPVSDGENPDRDALDGDSPDGGPPREGAAAAAPLPGFVHPSLLLDSFGGRARRRFGQNFLAAPGVVDGICRAAGVGPGSRVVEVGPGLGVLTGALLARGADVVAVELDRDLVAFLSERFAAPLASGQLRLVPGDAAKVDWPTLLPGAGWICAANLPYNVGTGILTAMVDLPGTFRRLVLMLQREVARRVVAGAGDEARGSLSVYVEARAEARVAIKVPPGCFFPAPKVHSAVLQIDLLAAPRTGAVAPALLEAVCLGAFAQPRKAIRKSLRGRWPGEAVDAALEAAGIPPLARPADLDLAAWLRVAAALGWTGAQAPG